MICFIHECSRRSIFACERLSLPIMMLSPVISEPVYLWKDPNRCSHPVPTQKNKHIFTKMDEFDEKTKISWISLCCFQMITFCSVCVVHSVPFWKSHSGCVIMRTLNLSCLYLGDRTADFIWNRWWIRESTHCRSSCRPPAAADPPDRCSNKIQACSHTGAHSRAPPCYTGPCLQTQ